MRNRQVAGCESCGESDYVRDALLEADDEAAADGDAAKRMEDRDQNDTCAAIRDCIACIAHTCTCLVLRILAT